MSVIKCLLVLLKFPLMLSPGLLAPCSPFRECDRITDPKIEVSSVTPPSVLFSVLRSFCFLFFPPLRGNGVRRPPLCPHREGPPLHGVRWGILWARCGDGGAGLGPPPHVPARGLLPSPRRPPRHHWTYLERRGLPVSGKCPGPSRNQSVNRGSPLPAGGECGKPAGREYGKLN